MTNGLMTWGNLEPINSEEEFSRAVKRIVEEEGPRLDDLGVPETDFEPLDENVKDETARLKGDQINAMMQRWYRGWTWDRLPESLHGSLLDEWRAHLTVSCVGAYCAASGAFIRSILLDASTDDDISGTIESPLEAPTLVVFARPGSLLARDEGFEDSGVAKRWGPSHFAHRIALRCREQILWGELAWRFLVASFVNMEVENVLPRVTIRQTREGPLQVRL